MVLGGRYGSWLVYRSYDTAALIVLGLVILCMVDKWVFNPEQWDGKDLSVSSIFRMLVGLFLNCALLGSWLMQVIMALGLIKSM